MGVGFPSSTGLLLLIQILRPSICLFVCLSAFRRPPSARFTLPNLFHLLSTRILPCTIYHLSITVLSLPFSSPTSLPLFPKYKSKYKSEPEPSSLPTHHLPPSPPPPAWAFIFHLYLTFPTFHLLSPFSPIP